MQIFLLVLFIINLGLTATLLFLSEKRWRNTAALLREISDGKKSRSHEPAPVAQARKNDMLFPLRVQAAERLIVLVERIKPGMLVHRHLGNARTAGQLATLMLQNIRDEFEYNISQQLYVSERSWQLITAAREEVVQQIHLSLASIDPEAQPHLLASEMFAAELRFPEEALVSLRAELNAQS